MTSKNKTKNKEKSKLEKMQEGKFGKKAFLDFSDGIILTLKGAIKIIGYLIAISVQGWQQMFGKKEEKNGKKKSK